jgi:hypothetical protein
LTPETLRGAKISGDQMFGESLYRERPPEWEVFPSI